MKIPLQLTRTQLGVPGIVKARKHRIGMIPIDFAVDTGCDVSFLSFADILKYSIPQNTLRFEQHTYIGGSSWDIKEMKDVSITFENEDGKAETFNLKKFHAGLPSRITAKEIDKAQHIPSILGLDFLIENKLALYVNPSKNEFYIERL